MDIGMVVLVLAYVLSQFYRAFLAVLAPQLAIDIGAGAELLSQASGLWFLTFAAMQVPVGWALDHVGPRRTAGILLALGGGGGALVFALAQGPVAIYLSMVLIGMGCSPVLMASYYIFARIYSARIFATLAGAMIGVGSLGNLAGSLPLAWAAEAFGWRGTMAALAGLTLVVGLGVWLLVRDPGRAETHHEGGSLLTLLKMPHIWPILALMFVNYAPAAGLRGLWAGPYFADVFGMDATGIGRATLVMGIAMILGNFGYGPLDRLFGTRKWVIFIGNALGAVCLAGLALLGPISAGLAIALLAGVGLFGSSFPLIVAHGRSYFPPHLTGRGVTLLNLFGIGGAGLMQFATGRAFETGSTVQGQYEAVFLTFLVVAVAGLFVYLFSQDRMN